MDVYERNGVDERTALHIAARHDSRDCITTLINAGALVDAKDKDGVTPLQLGAWRGYCDIVRLLHGFNASIEELQGTSYYETANDCVNGEYFYTNKLFNVDLVI